MSKIDVPALFEHVTGHSLCDIGGHSLGSRPQLRPCHLKVADQFAACQMPPQGASQLQHCCLNLQCPLRRQPAADKS